MYFMKHRWNFALVDDTETTLWSDVFNAILKYVCTVSGPVSVVLRLPIFLSNLMENLRGQKLLVKHIFNAFQSSATQEHSGFQAY